MKARPVAASRVGPGGQGDGRRALVVHVLDRLATGGMETVALNVIERTCDRYRHHVISLRAPIGLTDRVRALGAPVETVDKHEGRDIRAYLRLWRRLARLRPAIVHTYNIGALDVAFWARVAGVAGVIHAEHGRDAADPHGRNRKYRLLRRSLAPAISAFVPVSRDLARWLVEDVGIAADKVHTICNGVDTQRFAPAHNAAPSWPADFAPAGATLIGSVGRLDPVKGFDRLIAAFARLCERLPDHPLRLAIVGDGPQYDRLARQVQSLGLADRVWLAGEREDIAAFMTGLDIYVCSSIMEGIALTVLEAMASGLPVVATRVGGNPELVAANETGTLVAPDDPAALAGAMAELVMAPERARSMGRAARQRAIRHFSIGTMTDQYRQLYTRVLRGEAGRAARVARQGR